MALIDDVQKIIFPIKDYADLCQRLRTSFGFAFVRQAYNFKLPGLIDYTQRLLRGDTRNRYEAYASHLIGTTNDLQQAKVVNVVELKERTASFEHLESFSAHAGIPATEIAVLLKYLVYWVIPAEKYMASLVTDDSTVLEAIISLREAGIRSNLQLIQAGITLAGRKLLAEKTKVSSKIIDELVNRADFSRLPWASKATISNIIGAGYANLDKLANANPDELYADFFRYGKSIGKNLKLGNEIENSFRIAKILPVVLQGG